MKKNKLIGIVLGAIGAILVIGGLYFAIYYLNYFGQGLIEFVSVNNVDSISRCGIVVPDMFLQLRDQFATSVLPVLYIGFPLAVIITAGIMFLSGYYFGRSSHEEDIESAEKREKEIEQEVQKRVVGKKTREEPEVEEYEEYEEEMEEKPVKTKKSKKR